MKLSLKKKLLITVSLLVAFVVLVMLVTFYSLITQSGNNSQDVEFSQAQKINLDFDGSKLELTRPDVLTVAISPPYAPFEYNNNGVLQGFDVECAKVIADDLNLKVKFVQMPFSSLLKNVEAGTKCDIALGGIQVTDERKATMNFSIPYFTDTSLLLTRKDLDITADNVGEKLKKGAARICVVESSTSADYCQEYYPQCELVYGQDFDECANKMILGQADLLLISTVEYNTSESVAKFGLKTVKNFEENKQEVAIAIPKSKTYLLEQINKIIQARWEDEYIWSLYTKYFT